MRGLHRLQRDVARGDVRAAHQLFAEARRRGLKVDERRAARVLFEHARDARDLRLYAVSLRSLTEAHVAVLFDGWPWLHRFDVCFALLYVAEHGPSHASTIRAALPLHPLHRPTALRQPLRDELLRLSGRLFARGGDGRFTLGPYVTPEHCPPLPPLPADSA